METHLDKWLYVLKNMERFDRIPEKIKDRIFQKVFKISEYHKMSKEERRAYEDSLKYYRDLKNSLDTAEQDGYLKAEGQLKPLLEEAFREKEEAVSLIRSAIRNMYARGFSIEELGSDFGISAEQVEEYLK